MDWEPKTTRIETARLVLRHFSPADVPALVLIAGSQVIADTTISVAHPFAKEDAERWILDSSGGSHDRMGLAITDKSSGALSGYVGLHHIDREHNQAEISFWIDPARQREGIAREAVTASVSHAFHNLKLNRLEAYFMTRNATSGRLLDSLGFSREGLLRERVVKWGRREDVCLCALLETDWRKAQTRRF